jgi:hypothetical protein
MMKPMRILLGCIALCAWALYVFLPALVTFEAMSSLVYNSAEEIVFSVGILLFILFQVKVDIVLVVIASALGAFCYGFGINGQMYHLLVLAGIMLPATVVEVVSLLGVGAGVASVACMAMSVFPTWRQDALKAKQHPNPTA